MVLPYFMVSNIVTGRNDDDVGTMVVFVVVVVIVSVVKVVVSSNVNRTSSADR